MIRLFAPPTRDVFIRPDGVTATNLVLHILAFIALFVPLQRAAKENLLDRLVVFLVPPDEVGTRDRGEGKVAWNVAAQDAGLFRHGAEDAGNTDNLAPRGRVPLLEAADLEAANRPLPSDNALTVLEVDSAVVRDPSSSAPEYPPHLLLKGIEGSAAVRYVVDSTGDVDTLTYRVVQATDVDFAVAVRRALPNMRFHPAIRGGHRVRQLVEQTFRFRVVPSDTVHPPPA